MTTTKNFSIFPEENRLNNLHLHQILLNISDGCYYLNQDMQLLFINRSAENMLNIVKDEILGRNIFEAIPDLCNKVRKQLYQSYKKQKGINFNLSYTNEKYFKVKTIPDTTGLLVIMQDITETTKEDDRKAYYEKLRLIGEMAAGVAHEVRNPLTTVKGFLQLVEKNEDLLKYQEIFLLMINEIDRINTIISEFLDMAKNKPRRKEKEHLNEIIQSIYPLLETRALKENKKIHLHLHPLPLLNLDQNEMRQLIINMVNNSLDAMKAKASIHIRTYLDRGQVVLSITDEGTGIAPEVMNKISTPFFTTKEKGTGLGLAISFAIAKRNNATIEFTTDSSGTTFYIRFTIQEHY